MQDPEEASGGSLELVVDEDVIEEVRVGDLVLGGAQRTLNRAFVLAPTTAQPCLEGGQIRGQDEYRDRLRYGSAEPTSSPIVHIEEKRSAAVRALGLSSTRLVQIAVHVRPFR